MQAANSIRANLPHAKMRRSDIATQAQRHRLLLQIEQQSSALLLELPHWCQTLVSNIGVKHTLYMLGEIDRVDAGLL